MHTPVSTKLAALGLALMITSLMIGGVAYLFNGRLHLPGPVIFLAQVQPGTQHPAVEAPRP